MKKIYQLVIIFIAMNVLVITPELKAQRPMHEIHSMLIFNFIKYIDWPDAAKSGDFIIAVYGDDDVYEQLNKFYSNRPIKGQSAQIINVSSVEELSSAHVIYLSGSKSRDFESLQTKFSGKPTLLITDKSGLGKKGSCINFREVGGKLKFEINQASFDSNQLKISNQLVTMGIMI
ncbi:YfiR family protein [Marivirga sp. S37H4]|uniref:YfiR family protein n=1 Tax=Marivirga aurantiaca TaxID=2802615 RepID=A0A934WYM4_9BACT|nr:YfiR family protein [Marivirga aurantiaca]MBK6265201.1 YfiR family protein [Marivirga aurantiaca]